MIIDPETSVAFTGHRDYRGERDEQLLAVVRRLYAEGYRTFLSGMAVGFDLAAAEAVISLRRELAGLKLVCVVPFIGQQCRFAIDDKVRFERICEAADQVVTLSPSYHRMVYMQRNDFLVDNASVTVAYFNGKAGGTEYTVQRALRSGHRIENLYLDPQQIFTFEP